MKVKNLLIEKEYIDILEKELCLNNISYVLIKETNYYELHFEENIYRLFLMEDVIVDNSMKSLEFDSNDFVFAGNDLKKEQSGYRKLKKNDYKKIIKKI